VRPGIAMSGEITIMGKVLGVGGIQAKLLAAAEAGVQTVLLPKENEPEVAHLPAYIRERVAVRYVSEIEEVLALALV
jgi:ATP-dependent Lon protease